MARQKASMWVARNFSKQNSEDFCIEPRLRAVKVQAKKSNFPALTKVTKKDYLTIVHLQQGAWFFRNKSGKTGVKGKMVQVHRMPAVAVTGDKGRMMPLPGYLFWREGAV
jgi:hypothetical protein